MDSERWISEKEVSIFTGIALPTLRNDRWRRTGIPYAKVSRSVRYKLSDVTRYMESRRVQTREAY